MAQSLVRRLSRFQFCRRFLGKPFLKVNETLWNRLPASWKTSHVVLTYGVFLNSLVRMRACRMQFHGTFFMRNRPELELIRFLAAQRPAVLPVKITVLACSNGAEVYSILWAIRSARPDLNVEVHAIDISPEIIEVAKRGVYSAESTSLVRDNVFERLTEQEIAAMFDQENGRFRIKSWIAQGVDWQVGDAANSQLAERLGPADIVVANKFLCHMAPSEAETCLRNLAKFVKRGGNLVVSGVDLDLRLKVAVDLGWTPVPDLLEEIHDGDPSVRRDWPWRYWGLEPFDSKQPDWKSRYAAVFQVGSPKQTTKLELAAQ